MDCAFCQTPLPEESRFCIICGADLSDPEVSTRERSAIRELYDTVKQAVEDRYRVTAVLGRGGMGAVFLAEDLRLGRWVALKVLRPELAEEPSFIRRFEREAKIAAQLDHTNIIPIYEVERVGDLHYFVMKYVGGRSLDELLAAAPLPYERALDFLWQAARGLGHAHRRGVVHRDVKPSNIMVDETGRVIITDFGISKALESTTQYTSVGQMIGTPRYVSPEQAKAQPIDGRSDQYSLAVVGYQMLVGQLPLVSDTVHGLMYMHIYEMPKPARTVRPEIPAAISDVLQKALAKDPEQRFPSMEVFAQALIPERQIDSGSVAPAVTSAVTPPAPASRTPPTIPVGGRKSPLSALAAASAALVVVVGLVLFWYSGRNGSFAPGEDTATRPEQSAQSATPGDSAPSDSASTNRIPVTVAGDTIVALGPSKTDSPPVAGPDTAAIDPGTTVPAAASIPAAPTRPRRSERKSARQPTTEPAESAAVGSADARKPAVGYLTINAVPYGTVSVDGIEVGDTPVFRYELFPGTHVVRITRPGFRTDSLDATITAGNEVRLTRTLVREAR